MTHLKFGRLRGADVFFPYDCGELAFPLSTPGLRKFRDGSFELRAGRPAAN